MVLIIIKAMPLVGGGLLRKIVHSPLAAAATFFCLATNALQLVPLASAFSIEMVSPPTSTIRPKAAVIDSHLHVWACRGEAAKRFPYAEGQEPPDHLSERASTSELLKQLAEAGVDGALIVQPINHKFDHSYVEAAIMEHPTKFKGMLLADPSLPPELAVERLEELSLKGFVGVRFNPYLWPKGRLMSEEGGCGEAVFKRCAELKMPVGIMVFEGLLQHFDDICALIESSPETTVILDHLGFTGLNDDGDKAFQQLLTLKRHKNVMVKISALFRIAGPGDDPYPYEGVRARRFEPLLREFGAHRLMVGTDFPYVLQEDGGYGGTFRLLESWLAGATSEKERAAVMGGTAEKLFGPWSKY